MASRRALVSVYNKKGLVEFASSLYELGFELVSTGGTFKQLSEAGIKVTQVSDVTKFPEILGGRVKTLHPIIHGGILAKNTEAHQEELKSHSIAPISLVVCNLYPFVETVKKSGVTDADIIEEIDIGGVTLLRAAAKNHEGVVVVSDPCDYNTVAEALRSENGVSSELRKKLALKAFRHTASYDSEIANWFTASIEGDALPQEVSLHAERIERLRYGENPHQQGSLYRWVGSNYPFEQLQGKELSYNNILDVDAAWECCMEFADPACVIIKHLTPCGIATADNIVDAYKLAYESDTVSAFGSIIAVNRGVDVPLLEAIGSLFLEVLVARSFTNEAVEWLSRKKKNCRVMRVKGETRKDVIVRSVFGGLLVQTNDLTGIEKQNTWKVVSKVQPTEQQLKELAFAWLATKHVKSNAIVFVKGTATVGIGCGQPNRLDSVRNAAHHAGDKSKGACLGSDAFFPFPDGIEAAAAHGVVAIVQPGGSMRDEEVIAAADRLGLAMVFTGERHFKH